MSARPAQLDYAARAARARGGDARPGHWSSGWVVFFTVVLLGVAGAVVYARDGRPEVIFRLLVEGDRMTESFQRPDGTRIAIIWRRAG